MWDEEEARLIESVLAGNHDDFAQLIRPHLPQWLALASAWLGNSFDADDAVQSAMIRCYEGLGSFRQEAKFSTWATKIVLRECKGIYKGRAINTVSWSELHGGTTVLSENSEDLVLLKELVYRCLDREEQRLFTELLEKGRSIHEVADEIGASPGAVKTRIWRIRARLKNVLRIGGDG
jgi:RNA polymerase sigma-70 factor (ECF subfamily)